MARLYTYNRFRDWDSAFMVYMVSDSTRPKMRCDGFFRVIELHNSVNLEGPEYPAQDT